MAGKKLVVLNVPDLGLVKFNACSFLCAQSNCEVIIIGTMLQRGIFLRYPFEKISEDVEKQLRKFFSDAAPAK